MKCQIRELDLASQRNVDTSPPVNLADRNFQQSNIQVLHSTQSLSLTQMEGLLPTSSDTSTLLRTAPFFKETEAHCAACPPSLWQRFYITVKPSLLIEDLLTCYTNRKTN